MAPDLVRLLEKSLVLGALGGGALVLTTAFSRRGPLIIPVYGALFILLGAVSLRSPNLTLEERTLAVFCGTILSFLVLLVGVVVLSGRDRAKFGELELPLGKRESGKEASLKQGAKRVWLLVGTVAALALLSCAVAFVAS